MSFPFFSHVISILQISIYPEFCWQFSKENLELKAVPKDWVETFLTGCSENGLMFSSSTINPKPERDSMNNILSKKDIS